MLVICMASVLQTERSRLSKSQVDPKRIDNGSSFFFPPNTKVSFPPNTKAAHPIKSELLILVRKY